MDLLHVGRRGLFNQSRRPGQKPYIDQRRSREICHRCKQGLVYAVEIGWSAMGLLGSFPTDADLGGADASAEEAAHLLARRIEAQAESPPTAEFVRQKLEAAPDEVAKIQKLMADRDAMEDTKWEGLYANYEADPPTTPQKVDQTSVREVPRLRRQATARFLLLLPHRISGGRVGQDQGRVCRYAAARDRTAVPAGSRGGTPDYAEETCRMESQALWGHHAPRPSRSIGPTSSRKP